MIAPQFNLIFIIRDSKTVSKLKEKKMNNTNMNNKSNTTYWMYLGVLGVLSLLCLMDLSRADEYSPNAAANPQASNIDHQQRGNREWDRRHAVNKQIFYIGVCVGETLAQSGIVLPNTPAARKAALNDGIKASITAAITTCKQEARPAPSINTGSANSTGSASSSGAASSAGSGSGTASGSSTSTVSSSVQ